MRVRSTDISFLSTILCPNYTDSNLYSHTLSKLLLGTFSSITITHTAINRYSSSVLGGVGNNLNTAVMYLFSHTGTKFSKG